MVARLKITPYEASAARGTESDPQRVIVHDSVIADSPGSLWTPRTSNPQQTTAQVNLFDQDCPHLPDVQTPLVSRSDNNESPSTEPVRGMGRLLEGAAEMPRRLFDDLSEDVRPERTKKGFAETLKPISRKKNLRSVARFKRDAPVLCCVDTIERYKRLSGLTTSDIAQLLGVSRPTVAKALKADPSTNLYLFCEVLNVIGMEVAEAFPMRKKLAVNGPTWQRGKFHSTANLARAVAQINEQKRERRKRNNWE